ncbi:aminotransferase class IV family protein [Streptomyces sp. UNOC14_S4]|uniref:aminotransferase class IV family protein n=1 Tax=Streptomyces sp. UNOC14_S4 TaxID=2872340 RepID=UPI001E3BE7B8|nr:aminotransferase class IV family protein [Streptomyces sp. UNOC14_S4]MCC3772992.1 aminotransferase class IV family protein [Streptomyces sp. UNOC14_S4]
MMELNGSPASSEALATLALTNFGHFTSMRVDDQHVRGLPLHMERLARDCRAVFGTELDLDRVRSFAHRAVDGTSGTFIVRVTIFDPALDIGRPSSTGAPQILVTRRAASALPLPPLRVKTVPYIRDAPAVKHIGLFGTLNARRSAQLAGFDDALFTGPRDLVSEGGTWNVAFIDDGGTIVWPKADILPGVTMALLQEHHQHAVAPVAVGAAHDMQAAFATNTTIGVRTISAIDNVRFPTEHPVLAKLRESYLSLPGERL